MNETAFFFKLASELAAARRAGDTVRISEARGDIEMVAMHSDNPKLIDRALAALAA
jgi:hypothetical protein